MPIWYKMATAKVNATVKSMKIDWQEAADEYQRNSRPGQDDRE